MKTKDELDVFSSSISFYGSLNPALLRVRCPLNDKINDGSWGRAKTPLRGEEEV